MLHRLAREKRGNFEAHHIFSDVPQAEVQIKFGSVLLNVLFPVATLRCYAFYQSQVLQVVSIGIYRQTSYYM